MILQPLGKRLLVKEVQSEKIDNGIILLNETTNKKYEVIAVGTEPCDCKVGDTILISKHAGNELNFENEKFLLINYGDPICVLEEVQESTEEVSQDVSEN